MSVQPDHAVRTQQLGLRQREHQLTTRGATGPLLDRPDTPIQDADQVQLAGQLGDRRDTRHPGQGRVRGADQDPLGPTATTTYSFHRQGASPD